MFSVKSRAYSSPSEPDDQQRQEILLQDFASQSTVCGPEASSITREPAGNIVSQSLSRPTVPQAA